MKAFPTELPIDGVLDDLHVALGRSSSSVLVAAPGAGKTTRVPLSLLEAPWILGKNILMLEPRRLATRRSADYMARLLGEQCGETVGYRIRSESRVGRKTRIEVVTEGILTRMIQENPELPDIGLLIFDEYHERSIHADLGLALAIDVQQNLRDDLRILLMSATMDGAAVSSLLGNAPVLQSKGRAFPVETRYLRLPLGGNYEKKIPDIVAETLREEEGDILIFLPGRREIRNTENLILERLRGKDVLIVPLYGDLPSSEQDRALMPDGEGRRKIILSTSIAETSVTIDGVRIVIDSGVMRSSRFDPRRGMSGLVTLPVSKATADQRRGRAGRQQTGICYRLWTEQEHEGFADYPQPEILSTDLTSFAMELAQWGVTSTSSLAFLDHPPERHLEHARDLLLSLNAIRTNGQLTVHGKALAALPVHPRLAHMIIVAKGSGQGGAACDLAALLEEREISSSFDKEIDIAYRWHEFRKHSHKETRALQQAERLKRIIGSSDAWDDDPPLGWLLSLAFPERIGRKRDSARPTYQTVGGLTVRLPEASLLQREEYLVFPEVDGTVGEVRAFIAASITKEEILQSYGSSVVEEKKVAWDPKTESVRATRIARIGSVQISEHPVTLSDDEIVDAVCDGIRLLGLNCLPWDKECESFRSRSEWLRAQKLTATSWPVLNDDWLMANLGKWLASYLNGIRKKSQFATIPLMKSLKALFTYQQLRDLDRLAPVAITVPSGSSVHINYSPDGAPVLAVKLQEMFGLTESPRLADGRAGVVIHLLSPARRPLAVTQDLHSFWTNTYPEIRKQLRAEYPKHPWPEDPLKAIPTKKTVRALKKERG